MRKWLNFIVLFISLGLVIAGCRKEIGPTETDEDAINSLISELADWFDEGGHTGEEDTTGPKAAILPVFWHREINRPIPRTITIDIIGDSASVTVTADISGTFHILALDTIGDTIIHYTKPLADTGVRYAIFKRDTVTTYHRGWRLDKISGVLSVSDVNTVMIDSVHIATSSIDTTITNPLNLFNRESVLTLPPGESVILTVYTNDDTAFAFLHTWRLNKTRRWRFNNVGGGVYTGTWGTPQRVGVHHAAVDMLQYETLCDDTYPYDSRAWLLLYRVE